LNKRKNNSQPQKAADQSNANVGGKRRSKRSHRTAEASLPTIREIQERAYAQSRGFRFLRIEELIRASEMLGEGCYQ